MSGPSSASRVLVTGSEGFIGSAIVTALGESGSGTSPVEVVRVDALLPEAHGTGVVPGPGVHRLDVRDADAWSHLLDGVDVVCHQAALVGAGVTVADLPGYAAHNDLGTAALLAAMAARGVDRLVLASSMVVYGEGRYLCAVHGAVQPAARRPDDLAEGRFEPPCPTCGRALRWGLVDEGARLDPRSAYAASKLAQEHYATAWARQTGGRVVALRYHNVYGPGMPRDTPYAGVAALFRSALARGEPPRVFEDGGQMRDFVHVADVARANLCAIDAVGGVPAGAAAAYNVCSGTPVSIAEVAALVTAGGGVAPVVTGEYRLGDVRHVVASPQRARAELGFTARVAPSVGLPAFADEPLRDPVGAG